MNVNTVAFGVYPIESLPIGEYVVKARQCRACGGNPVNKYDQDCVRCNGIGWEGSNKVYIRKAYDNAERKYQLDDCDDISRCVYVKKGAKVIAGFTY